MGYGVLTGAASAIDEIQNPELTITKTGIAVDQNGTLFSTNYGDNFDLVQRFVRLDLDDGQQDTLSNLPEGPVTIWEQSLYKKAPIPLPEPVSISSPLPRLRRSYSIKNLVSRVLGPVS